MDFFPDDKSLIVIDKDVILEVFEYIVKEVSRFGEYEFGEMFFNRAGSKVAIEFFSEKKPYVIDVWTKRNSSKVSNRIPVSFQMEGRSNLTPDRSFRRDRKIGKFIADKLHDINEKKVIRPKKKIKR